jgi:glycosyltransferase involved in cell wall biosynthesis
MKKVSVITSVYNKEPWLKACIESVLSQTYTNIEFVIVNNASPDRSIDIIEHYAKQDSRIVVVNVEVNEGGSGGINAGIEVSTGEYIAIIDADDYIDSNYVEELYKAIEQEGADISMCVNDLVWDDGHTWHKNWPGNDYQVIQGEDIKKLPCQLLNEQSNKYFGFYMPEVGAEWAKMYKASIIKGNYIKYDVDLTWWCDWVFHMYVIKNISKIVYIKSTTYHFYQSPDSTTRAKKFNSRYISQILIALEKMYLAISDIKDENVEAAFNVFVLRNLKLMMSYIVKYYKNGIERVDLDRLEGLILDNKHVHSLLHSSELSMFDANDLKIIGTCRSGIVSSILKRYRKNRVKEIIKSILPAFAIGLIKKVKNI